MRRAGILALVIVFVAAVSSATAAPKDGPTAVVIGTDPITVKITNNGTTPLVGVIVKDSANVANATASTGSVTILPPSGPDHPVQWKGSIPPGGSLTLKLTASGAGHIQVFASVNDVFSQIPTTYLAGPPGNPSTTKQKTYDVYVDINPRVVDEKPAGAPVQPGEGLTFIWGNLSKCGPSDRCITSPSLAGHVRVGWKGAPGFWKSLKANLTCGGNRVALPSTAGRTATVNVAVPSFGPGSDEPVCSFHVDATHYPEQDGQVFFTLDVACKAPEVACGNNTSGKERLVIHG
jgi:hypothetical protein